MCISVLSGCLFIYFCAFYLYISSHGIRAREKSDNPQQVKNPDIKLKWQRMSAKHVFPVPKLRMFGT
jgi:hypothetical protein